MRYYNKGHPQLKTQSFEDFYSNYSAQIAPLIILPEKINIHIIAKQSNKKANCAQCHKKRAVYICRSCPKIFVSNYHGQPHLHVGCFENYHKK